MIKITPLNNVQSQTTTTTTTTTTSRTQQEQVQSPSFVEIAIANRIDVRNEEEEDDEKVCRICQLSSDQLLPQGAQNVKLVVLGCSCKGDLGIAHYNCAFVWFHQKGNRTCEICEKPAKNIKGIQDTGLRTSIVSDDISMGEIGSNERQHRCTKFMCNILLAILIIALLLPWAFHPSKIL